VTGISSQNLDWHEWVVLHEHCYCLSRGSSGASRRLDIDLCALPTVDFRALHMVVNWHMYIDFKERRKVVNWHMYNIDFRALPKVVNWHLYIDFGALPKVVNWHLYIDFGALPKVVNWHMYIDFRVLLKVVNWHVYISNPTHFIQSSTDTCLSTSVFMKHACPTQVST